MPGIRVSAAHMPAVCKLVLREAEGSAKKKVPGRNIKPRTDGFHSRAVDLGRLANMNGDVTVVLSDDVDGLDI